MKTALCICVVALAIMMLLPFSIEKVYAADCSGDQILRMLDAGFSREEVLDICGPVRGQQEGSPDKISFRVITDTNVRQGPSTEHGIVTTLSEGALVDVVGTSRSRDSIWYQIAVDGKELGYISGNLLEPTID
jgi:uncharacterized protein YgiM (DUF1202 family)